MVPGPLVPTLRPAHGRFGYGRVARDGNLPGSTKPPVIVSTQSFRELSAFLEPDSKNLGKP